MKIIVLGAGLMGATTAYELAARGHEVDVFEKREGAGLETSYANGGQLSACEVAPWAGTEIPGEVLRWMGDPKAPFRMRIKADPDQWLWLMRFLLRCRPGARESRIVPNLTLALHGRARMDAIAAGLEARGEGFDFDERQQGILRIYREQAYLDQALHELSPMNDAGLTQLRLTAEECLAIEPALAPAFQRGEIQGGIHCPGDRSGDAHKYAKNIAAAAEKSGARFHYGATAERLVTRGRTVQGVVIDGAFHEADGVVLAAGVGSAALSKAAGVRIPVYPVKGYSVTIPAPDTLAPEVSVSDETRKVVVSRLGDRLRSAGQAEVGGYDLTLEMPRARSVLNALCDLYPQVNPELGEKDANVEFWCGLRPMTPDGSPIIDRVPRYDNLVLNTGHGTLGWTLCAGSASLAADLVEERQPAVKADDFSLSRFHKI
ncbi:MAG: D-amino acid dehydrogenase [Parvibaculaceae bacterium]|nr:D-amino acid dehydrogenase [Parvibaculaceae bacterium]